MKNKYNIGDKVWRIYSSKIEEIEVMMIIFEPKAAVKGKSYSRSGFSYGFEGSARGSSNYGMSYEEELFPSKDALVGSL